jgi:hypothetical protein
LTDEPPAAATVIRTAFHCFPEHLPRLQSFFEGHRQVLLDFPHLSFYPLAKIGEGSIQAYWMKTISATTVAVAAEASLLAAL